jgi:biopolymer transport protein ExbD
MIKHRKIKKDKSFTNINITPLTDIALTLLTVFMIATPMIIQSHISVNLPKVEHKNESLVSTFLTITIDKKGRIFIDNRQFDLKNLEFYIKDYIDKKKEVNVVINGDKSVNYDSVVKVLDLVKNLGITKISLGIEV